MILHAHPRILPGHRPVGLVWLQSIGAWSWHLRDPVISAASPGVEVGRASESATWEETQWRPGLFPRWMHCEAPEWFWSPFLAKRGEKENTPWPWATSFVSLKLRLLKVKFKNCECPCLLSTYLLLSCLSPRKQNQPSRRGSKMAEKTESWGRKTNKIKTKIKKKYWSLDFGDAWNPTSDWVLGHGENQPFFLQLSICLFPLECRVFRAGLYQGQYTCTPSLWGPSPASCCLNGGRNPGFIIGINIFKLWARLYLTPTLQKFSLKVYQRCSNIILSSTII